MGDSKALENSAVQNGASLFDKTAEEFAARADSQIEEGRYRRGELFLNAALSNIPSNGYVLDFGCGPGRISSILAKGGFRVLGVDPSSEMIAVARRQSFGNLPLAFQTTPAEFAIPQGEQFDGIICSSVIEYSSDPVRLLRAFRSVLRPSGALIISFANSRSIFRAPFQHRNLHLGAQVHTWPWPRFRTLMEQAGLRIVVRPQYFEGPVERIEGLRFLISSQFGGTLGLVVAAREG